MEDVREIEVLEYEVVTDHKQIVWGLVEERHKNSGGHNGIEIAEIKNRTNLTINEIKAALIELHKEQKTKVREQKNGRAIYVR